MMSINYDPVESLLAIESVIAVKHKQLSSLYSEARAHGIDVGVLKSIVARRRNGGHDITETDVARAYAQRARPDRPRLPPRPYIVVDSKFTNGTVYFAHFPVLGRLKIGISTDVRKRLISLRTTVGDEPVLLGVFKGDRKAEIAAHHAFSAFRLTGEWFAYPPECVALVSEYLRARTDAA